VGSRDTIVSPAVDEVMKERKPFLSEDQWVNLWNVQIHSGKVVIKGTWKIPTI